MQRKSGTAVLENPAASQDEGRELKLLTLTDVKPTEEDKYPFGGFSGYASVFGNVDSYKDVVVPGAYKDTLDKFVKEGFIAWQHGAMGDAEPIATIAEAGEDDHGLKIVVEYHSTDYAQSKRKIVNERLERGKSMGLSIGYVADDFAFRDDGVRLLRKITLYEVSLVTLPANDLAQVTQAKHSAIVAQQKAQIAADENKAVNPPLDLPLGPRTRSFDRAAAEGRIRKWAGVADAPNTKYASAFVWKASSGTPDKFGDYKLPVIDTMNGTAYVMPRAIFRNAVVVQGGRGGLDVPSEDRAGIKATLGAYYARMRKEFDDENLIAPWDRDQGKSAGEFKWLPEEAKAIEESPPSDESVGMVAADPTLADRVLSTLAQADPDQAVNRALDLAEHIAHVGHEDRQESNPDCPRCRLTADLLSRLGVGDQAAAAMATRGQAAGSGENQAVTDPDDAAAPEHKFEDDHFEHQDADPEEHKKPWDTAFQNDLPDSAFAVILPGGSKDSDGRTVPRSLRMLPHHGTSGAVDLPHLRNALARLAQADIPEAQRNKAEAHLEKHAKAEGIGDRGDGKSALDHEHHHTDLDALPDTAFAYIEAGAKRDDTGRAEPRSSRRYVHHFPDGTVDVSSLRRALTAVPNDQAIPEPVKNLVLEHLLRHAEEKGIETDDDDVGYVPDHFEDAAMTFVDQTEKALHAVASLVSRSEAIHAMRQKLGRQLSARNRARLSAVRDNVQKLGDAAYGHASDLDSLLKATENATNNGGKSDDTGGRQEDKTTESGATDKSDVSEVVALAGQVAEKLSTTDSAEHKAQTDAGRMKTILDLVESAEDMVEMIEDRLTEWVMELDPSYTPEADDDDDDDMTKAGKVSLTNARRLLTALKTTAVAARAATTNTAKVAQADALLASAKSLIDPFVNALETWSEDQEEPKADEGKETESKSKTAPEADVLRLLADFELAQASVNGVAISIP